MSPMNVITVACSQIFGIFAKLLRMTLGKFVFFLLHDEMEKWRKKERAFVSQRLQRYQKRTEPLNVLQKLLKIHAVNKEKVEAEIAMSHDLVGTTEADRPNGVIVSLTSYPARLYDIHFTIHSLLSQTVKPERVVLWLGEDKFPNGEASVPQPVLDMKKRGLEIRFCKDERAFTKLLPALSAFPDKTIVTADDDIFYPSDWLEKLVAAYKMNPNIIWCNRVRVINCIAPGIVAPYKEWKAAPPETEPSFANFLTGVGGVLYPPNSMHQDVFDEETFHQTTPYNDDIWFWAMAVRKGTPIGVVPEGFQGYLVYVNPRREIGLLDDGTLSSTNVAMDRNEEQLKAVFDKYPEVLTRLLESLGPVPPSDNP